MDSASPATPTQHVLPASFAQQRLWFFTQLVPDVAVYNIGFLQPLAGACDPERVRRVLTTIAARHETMRTALSMRDGVLCQIVHREPLVALEISDLDGVTDAEVRTQELLAADSAVPFDLERAPLWRARLVRRGERDAVLAFVVHHAVFDAQSARNFVRELRELWADERAAVPELAVQYADFAAWQRDQLDGGALDEQLGYWRRRLADLSADTGLPTDRARPPRPSHRGADVTVELPVATNQAVRRFARDSATTPYAVLLAAFVALVSRLSGRTDVVVGCPVAGRQLPELAPLLGMFVNSLVLRTDCAGDPTFRALLDRATDTVADALEHADVPFDRLVEELAPDRDPSRSPLYQVVLNLMPDTGAPQTGNGTAKVDLILDLYDTVDGTLGARLEYATDLFDATTARAVLDRYALLLGAALAAPDTRLSALPLLLPGEPEHLRAAACGHRAAPAGAEPVVARFLRQVADRPDATAVRDSAGVELTYRELADRAGALAARLAAHGAGPERPVALLLDTDVELVVAVLGVLLSGSAYLPLDVEHPAGRIAHLLADTSPVAVVTTSTHRRLLPPDVPVVTAADVKATAATAGSAGVDLPEALAYVVHTSGSTGRPKGVGVTRANLAAYVDGLVRLLDPPAGATWAMLQPLTFDFAVTTFFGALLTGGTLCPVSRERATDAAWLAGHRADYLKITPSHLAALRSAVADPAELLPTRALVLGGEASRWADVQHLRALGRCDVLNHYGPTETTVGVLALPADGVAHPVGPHTPIGWPLAGAEAHVLDEHGRPVPDGVVGELCVGGDTVGRGYLGLPGLTAQRFVPDPFSRPGARLYRTGDRVRRLRCGAVEFLGRADDQVKLRGYRVEPGEVRHALTTHPDVAEAAVLVRDDRLVGYLVPTPGRRPDPAAVLAHVAADLPAHLVPSALVVLDRLPLTPHGKLDHARLPDPAPSTVDAAAAAGASGPSGEPAGAVEEVVAALFAELLGREVRDRHASFFAIGGHSLLGIRLMTRMRRAFGVALPLREVFENPTVAGIAARVTTRLRGGAGADDLPPVLPVPRDRPLPASYGQQRLWFLDQFDADTPLYNTHFTLRLTGRLDVVTLRSALVEIVRRHEILRTRFAASADGLVQVPHPHPELPFTTAELPAGASDRERWELLTGHAGRRFDLATDPPLRALLVRTGEDRHELLLTLHHTVFDGSSVAVLVGELARLYPALRDGGDATAAGLPDLAVQYADFAAWQRAVVAGELADTQLAYWRGRLAGLPPRLELPSDRPRPRRLGAGGQHQLFAVPPDVADRLRALGAEEGATLFMTLLAGYAVLLRRYTGQRDLAVGVPLITRQRPELEPLIGFFVNTLVLRVEAAGDPSLRELVRIARTATVEAYAHSDVPFEALVDELAPERDQGVTPLVQTMFMLADDQRALSLDLGGVTADFEPFALGYAKFDVSMFLWRRDDGLTGAVEYRPELFDDATMTRFVGHFVDLLTAAATAPDAPVSTLAVRPTAAGAGGAATAAVTAVGSAASGRSGWSDGVTVVDLVRERVRLAPDVVAVRDGDSELSYAELWRRAEALAARLPRRAVVGVCVPRSADLVVSLLGVLLAGSAYLPLDIDYPPARLAHTASDSGMAALVATPDTRTLVPFDGPVLVQDDGHHDGGGGVAVACGGAVAGPAAVAGGDPAYVLYTSGSTGLPKGVVVGHAALANQLRWAVTEFGLGPDDRVAQRTSAGFDASVWELFAPLVAGASVVTVPAGVAADPGAVVELVRANGITVLQLVPTLLAAYLEASVFTRCPTLRLVGCGGEALPQELADRMAAQTTARLVNLYGPTECCVQAVFATARPGAGRPTVPIGVPVPGVTVAVLDEAAHPVPDGVPGELYLGGVQVAHGYLGRAALTAERFVPDPAGPPGSRRYRTGDRVRLLPGGELEYLGRLDGQVKVRGVRVELGEVEAALADLPEVTQAVAVLRELATGPALVGYVVGPETSTSTGAPHAGPAGASASTGGSASTGAFASAALRERLRQRLPAAALPAAVLVLEAFPLLPNGKVDRAALPDPDTTAGTQEYVAPSTPTEELLCGLYERLLGRDRVGVRDDFFALGGHSLLVTRLVAGIADELGVELPLRTCFDAPTVAELAIAVLQAQLTDDDLDRLLLELSQDQDRESR